MNQNVKKMKEAIVSFHQKAKQADEAISKAKRDLKPEVAFKKIDILQAELKQEQAKAIDAIMTAGEQGKADVKKWFELNPADITDDAKLLQMGFPMNQADFNSLCRKYENNGTMCRILKDYAEKHNQEVQARNPKQVFPEGYLHTMNIPNIKSMMNDWDRITANAEEIIKRMEGHGFGVGVNDPVVLSGIEHFGEGFGER